MLRVQYTRCKAEHFRTSHIVHCRHLLLYPRPCYDEPPSDRHKHMPRLQAQALEDALFRSNSPFEPSSPSTRMPSSTIQSCHGASSGTSGSWSTNSQKLRTRASCTMSSVGCGACSSRTSSATAFRWCLRRSLDAEKLTNTYLRACKPQQLATTIWRRACDKKRVTDSRHTADEKMLCESGAMVRAKQDGIMRIVLGAFLRVGRDPSAPLDLAPLCIRLQHQIKHTHPRQLWQLTWYCCSGTIRHRSRCDRWPQNTHRVSPRNMSRRFTALLHETGAVVSGGGRSEARACQPCSTRRSSLRGRVRARGAIAERREPR